MSADATDTGETDVADDTDATDATGATDETDDPATAWKQWHEHRVAAVSSPYGPLALTGTHWLADYPEGRIPAVPGHWRAAAGGVTLTAAPGDGITLDGEPLAGAAVLAADEAPPAHSRLRAGEVRLVVIRREGEWAVRVFDPAAPGRAAFTGIEATPYDPAYAVPGHFSPYGQDRTVQVENVDGRARGLGLGGELSFAFAGARHTLGVAVDEEDGSLWAVIGDATGAVPATGSASSSPESRPPTARSPWTSTGSSCLPAPSRTTSSAPSLRRATPCPSRSRRAKGG